MAHIELTVKQIMNLGLWDKVCAYKGWSEWILNEGRIDENEIVEFDDEFINSTGEWYQLNYDDGAMVSYKIDTQNENVQIKTVTAAEEKITTLHFNEVEEILSKIQEMRTN